MSRDNTSYDIIVIGGGSAGICAAVQAGRLGKRTLLVEKTGLLGGTTTTGAVNAPASFFAHGKQVIAGIGWELVNGACGLEGRTPGVAPERPKVHIHVNIALYSALADELVLGSGAELLFHAMPAAVEADDDGYRLTLCTKTGLRTLHGRFLLDCTADANVVGLAGLPLRRPDVRQPGTLVVTAGGYDADALDYDAIQAAFDVAVAEGRVKPTDPGWKDGKVSFFLKSYGGNRIHVCDLEGSTSEARTVAEIEGRRAMMRLYHFLRTQPGLENFTITFLAPETGIRETVTIHGRARVTTADYEAGRVYDDAVCYSWYPIDEHLPTGINGRGLKKGVYPTLPLGCMIPDGASRLMAAGRCVDGEREAFSSFRVQAPCMAMGQAVAAAASIALDHGCEPHELPMAALGEVLRQQGAIVPPDQPWDAAGEQHRPTAGAAG